MFSKRSVPWLILCFAALYVACAPTSASSPRSSLPPTSVSSTRSPLATTAPRTQPPAIPTPGVKTVPDLGTVAILVIDDFTIEYPQGFQKVSNLASELGTLQGKL